MNEEKSAKGTEMMERLSGKSVDLSAVPEKFREYTVEHLFGDVWQGDELALEERSLITCAALVALAREPEQRFHFKGARNLGIPREKLVGMITHLAHYAGWPCAVGALRSLGEVWPEE